MNLDLPGLAAVVAATLTGVALIITQIAALVTALRSAKVQRGIALDQAVMHTDQTAMHAKVTQIDTAVNGKAPGETTMVSQVQDLHDNQFPAPTNTNSNSDALLPLLRKVADKVNALEARTTPPGGA